MSSNHRRSRDIYSSELSDLSDSRPQNVSDESKHPSKRQKKEATGKGIYCHQCHTKCSAEDSVRCTKERSFTKHTPARACNLAWCRKDLLRKYNLDIADIKRGKTYQFECPVCLGTCQCAQCRKKKGLEPLPLNGAKKTKPAAKQNKGEGFNGSLLKDSFTFVDNSDSELSDLPEVNDSSTKSRMAKKVTPKSSEIQPPRVKAKARPKSNPIVPPTFERVDTRLTRSQVEDRMALREYLFRFRVALSIPERNLSVLDDFDRPLAEGSVRLYAGAMLEVIKDGLGDQFADDLFDYREELRYYADLARFAVIFKDIEEPLGLKRHLVPKRDDVGSILVGDELIPWAAPTRRGASRVPLPEEVVDMLLALAERTLWTRVIRAELDNSSEVEARKQHAVVTKAVNAEWEEKKKKLAAERVVCKTAAQTKSNQAKMVQGQKEHDLEVALANVNLRASVAPIRHVALGKFDGRTYHLLTPRAVTNAARAPSGWASGLLVWGPAPGEAIPQWTHFDRSKSVQQLARWLESRIDAMRPRIVVEGVPGGTDSDSDLSSIPDDLMDLVEPIGYAQSIENQAEEGRELVRRIHEVAEWLRVLEWKELAD